VTPGYTRGSMRLTVMTYVLAVFLVSCAASTREAERLAPRALPYGVHFHCVWSDYTNKQRRDVLEKLESAGVKWLRIGLEWTAVETAGPGKINRPVMDRADYCVNKALQHDFKVLMVFAYTPAWAGPNRFGPPEDVHSYANAAYRMANHFQGRVAAWEVWNEPNLPSFWTGTPEDYAALLTAAYPRIKEADPSAKVVGGALGYNDAVYASRLYEAGIEGYFDVFSTHAYMSPSDLPPDATQTLTERGSFANVASVREVMLENGDGAKPIWFTEHGWSAHANLGTEPSWKLGVTEAQQADYLTAAYSYTRTNFPYVRNIIWYSERDRVTGDVHKDNRGLMERDLSTKPAYKALDRLDL
jgi:polysaccharide biosynthesis protein PslG